MHFSLTKEKYSRGGLGPLITKGFLAPLVLGNASACIRVPSNELEAAGRQLSVSTVKCVLHQHELEAAVQEKSP